METGEIVRGDRSSALGSNELVSVKPSTHKGALIDAMRRIALAKGFPATTVDEVCERAGVTKGSFYHHFNGKDDLGLAALQAYFEDVGAAFSAGEWSTVEDPVERLLAFVTHAAEVSGGPVMVYGCLIGSFALDLAETWPDLQERTSTMFGALRDVVAGLVRDAANSRGRSLDADLFGDQFLAVVEGSIVLAKAHADPAITQRGITLFGQHLELLLR